MNGRLKTAMEISLEQSSRFSPGGGSPLRGLDDLGLEAFLRLLNPELSLPVADVKPRLLTVKLRERNERREISLGIRNLGRGYLSGSIEVSDNIPGLELSSGRFGVDGRDRQEAQITIHINGSQLEPGRRYNTNLTLLTNGQPEKIVVKLVVQLVDGQARAREMTGFLIKYGTLAMLGYWLLLLHKISLIYGFDSPFSPISDSTILARTLLIYLFLLAVFNLPLLRSLCGRRTNNYLWLLWAISLIYTVYKLERVISAGTPEIASAVITIYALAIIVPAVIIVLVRQTYYRLPHLHGSLALGLIVVITALLWGGLNNNPSWLVAWSTKLPIEQTQTGAELILHAMDNDNAIYHLSRVEQKRIEITFSQDCWVRARQDGELITEKTYTPGEEITLSDATETYIRLGFPLGAHIMVNGIALDDDIPSAPFNIIIVKQQQPKQGAF
ncbi:MAG: DUF4115 domain-containing protein [Firmicutes bacterium]|nr:DUF4115 domain-containing protein [Bacillota bacterium]